MSVNDMVVGPWGVRFLGRRFPASIGKGGIRSDKREGDGATPRAILHVTGMLYRADRITRPTAWADPIGPWDLWSDASDDPHYNLQVRAPYAPSHEKLRRADPLYDLVMITDWNWPVAEPGMGSAIFIHRWRKPRHPTEGCVAFRADHLRWIAERVSLGTRIVVL